jgi:hypothetical protein
VSNDRSTDGDVALERRQEVFRVVVEAQDRGETVAASRTAAARQFSLTEEQVKAIEREGLANEWPPL